MPGRLLSFPNPNSPRYRALLAGGDQGTSQTIEAMRGLIDQALTDASFVRFVIDLVRSVPAYDETGEVQAIYNWVLSNIRFTKDPVSKEKLTSPQDMLQIRAGDCDCIVTLLGAMLLAIGYPARVVTVAADPSSPQEFSHVYLEAEVPPGSNSWIPLDAARPGAQFAMGPETYSRKRVWNLIDSGYQDVSGLGSYGLGEFAAGPTWEQIVAGLAAQVPQDIAIASGGGNPYGSFVTPNTPGYGIPQAGYPAAGVVNTSWFSQATLIAGYPNWQVLGLGAALYFLLRGR